MDSREETKVAGICESFQMGGERSEISALQARRRFMITDILNSSLESRDQKGLDMRLLFPHLPLNLSSDPEKADTETDTDNEAEEDGEADYEKGEFFLFLFEQRHFVKIA